MITQDMLIHRKLAWEVAETLVTPVLEKHGLEDVKYSTAVFVPPSTVTKVEQNLDAIERVASWLLEIN